MFVNLINVILKYALIVALAFLIAAFLRSDPEMQKYAVIALVGTVATASFSYYESYNSRKREQTDDFARKLFFQLDHGTYFESKSWLNAYRKFCFKHPMARISAGSLSGDLSRRYIKRIIRRDWYILIWIPAAALFLTIYIGNIVGNIVSENFISNSGFVLNWTLISCAVISVLYAAVLYLLSGNIFRSWLRNNPQYCHELQQINSSYIQGTAFATPYSCVVVGDPYIHAFDGRQFHTFPKSQIREVFWHVDRFLVFSKGGRCGVQKYKGDEYRFYVVFQNAGEMVKIPLDQFQIRQMMDNYFEKQARKQYVKHDEIEVGTYEFSSYKRFTSDLIFEDYGSSSQ